MTERPAPAIAKYKRTPAAIHIFLILCSVIFIIPFMIVVSASLTDDAVLSWNGFSLFIPKFDIIAYRFLFTNPKIILNAYTVTMFIAAVGTAGGVLVMSMIAYSLSRNVFFLRKQVTFILFFPALFNGGLVSSYIINSHYLKLRDSVWVLILPGLINIFHVIIFRTFFKQLPSSIFEAAKIDGASEFRLFFTILLPLSKPVLATIAFLTALGKWNEWYNAMLYINNDRLMPLQYQLQRMMMDLAVLKRSMEYFPAAVSRDKIPGENLRMAMLVVSIGPMLIFFPAFQKYFTKGITIGSIKG